MKQAEFYLILILPIMFWGWKMWNTFVGILSSGKLSIFAKYNEISIYNLILYIHTKCMHEDLKKLKGYRNALVEGGGGGSNDLMPIKFVLPKHQQYLGDWHEYNKLECANLLRNKVQN